MKTIFAILAAITLTSFAATDAKAQDTYRLQPGDTVRVEVLEDETLNRDSLVRPDGLISVPFAGSIQAGGRTVEQVRQEVQTRLTPNFASAPNVFVTLAARPEPRDPVPPLPPRVMPVYVIGEANEPGLIEAREGATVLQVLSQMGGFTRFAATDRLMLRRTDRTGQQQVYQFSYDAIMAGTDNAGATTMIPGDVIIIPQRRLFE